MNEPNKLVLIGNGFDLAHGLKTSYKDFLNWYMCEAFKQFHNKRSFKDSFIEMSNRFSYTIINEEMPKTFEEVLNKFSSKENSYRNITYKSNFFLGILNSFKAGNWVDIERHYFKILKADFSNPNEIKKELIANLNSDFDFLILQLSKYIESINNTISEGSAFRITAHSKLAKVFAEPKIKFLNFNYTETLFLKRYADEEDIIHIHGRVADIHRNPIIFGYGDESDPDYQKIEDSGENMYLEHIKS